MMTCVQRSYLQMCGCMKKKKEERSFIELLVSSSTLVSTCQQPSNQKSLQKETPCIHMLARYSAWGCCMLSFKMQSGKEMVYVCFVVGATFYLSSEPPIELITQLKLFISWHISSYSHLDCHNRCYGHAM